MSEVQTQCGIRAYPEATTSKSEGTDNENMYSDNLRTSDIEYSKQAFIRRVALNGKPEWPYQEWRFEEVPRQSSELLLRHCCTSQEDDSSDSTSTLYEPDHWLDEMSESLSSNIPLVTMLEYFKQELEVPTDLYQEVGSDMLDMISSTANLMRSALVVFQECYVLQVGSTTENTKVGKPDEFDFAVVLPYFEKSNNILLPILRSEGTEKLLDNPDFYSLIKELAGGLTLDNSEQTVLENFQYVLKQAWAAGMKNNIPLGWTILETKCHEDSSVAGRFHFKRDQDGFVVDVDICFWTAIHVSQLTTAEYDTLAQRDYIVKYCLDDDQKIFVVLPTDYRIDDTLNIQRFAMSIRESKELNKYGDNNGRIKTYKLAKCIASCFLPKKQKHADCDRCFDSIVPSYCLKNIVFYMANYHLGDDMWVAEQIGNRVVEVFTILNFCMKVNCSTVSAFFTPYYVQLETQKKFNPEKKEFSDNSFAVCNDQDYSYPNEVHLPESLITENCFQDDPLSTKLLKNYFDFIYEKDWTVPTLIDRLNEMFFGLLEEDEMERKKIADNPGCLCFQPYVY